ncbi:extracellular solute-binding protein [Paenibacillus sp. strain BS8-2]
MKKTGKLLLTSMLMLSILAAGCSNANQNGSNANNQEGSANGQNGNAANADKEIPNFNATGFPLVTDKITLKMMGSKAPIQGEWNQLSIFKKMEELTNISFTFDTPVAANYEEKKKLAFASGQIPDVFFGANLTPSDEVNFGEQGILIPLENLIKEYAPTIEKLLNDDPNIRRSITATDGHIYALPQITAGFGLYPKLWINKKWMDNLGLEEPKTIDDLYTVLKAFKEKDPNQNGQADEIPMSGHGLDIRQAIEAAYGLNPNGNIENVEVKDGKVVYSPIEEGYQKYLTFMHKLYAEELLDSESFSQTPQQVVAKGQEGKLGSFNSAGPFLIVGVDKNYDYVQLKPLTSELSSEPIWPLNSPIRRGAFAITNKNKNPEATIRWVDYLYTEEGSIMMAQGVEGQDFEYTAEGGFQMNIPEGMNSQEFKAGMVSPDAGTVVPLDRRTVDEIGKIGTEKANPTNFFIRNQTEERLMPYGKETYPNVYFTNEEQDRLNTLMADIRTYTEQMEAKFVAGTEPLTKWDSYVATLKDMGVDEYVSIYQAAYDRWKDAK